MFSPLPASTGRHSLLAIGLAAFLGLSACSEQETKPVAESGDTRNYIAKVDGVGVTQRELALAEAELGDRFNQAPAEQRRAMILEALMDIKALAAAARKEGFADQENFKARMAFTRDRSLHNSFFEEKGLKTISDEDLKARYDTEVAGFQPEKEIRARHILVETEAEAKEIITLLEGGADFAETAKEKSTGPRGPNGGDLDYFGKGRMVPEFESAAFALESGEFTKEPVKTQFGWHIIKKEDERDSSPPEFDVVKEQIRQILAQEKYIALTEEARKNFNAEILDEALRKQIEALQ